MMKLRRLIDDYTIAVSRSRTKHDIALLHHRTCMHAKMFLSLNYIYTFYSVLHRAVALERQSDFRL